MTTIASPSWWEIVLLFLIPLAIWTCQIVFFRKWKPFFDKRKVWVVISVAYFIYFFLVAWLPNIVVANTYEPSVWGHTWADPCDATQSRLISWIFALDLCQFIAIFYPIAIILDPSRKVARAFAPAAITGGLFTLITRVALDKTTEFTWSWIFLGMSSKVPGGDYPNHAAFYIYHVMNTCLAIAVLLYTAKTGPKGILWMIIAQLAYYCYVGLIIAATTARYSVAGLTVYDFMEGGNFKQITKLFHTSPGVALFLFHLITVGMSIGIWALNEYVFKKKPKWMDDADLLAYNKKHKVKAKARTRK